MLLLAIGPAAFMLSDEAGGFIWALIVLFGLIIACTTYRKWWLELRHERLLQVCLGVLTLYLGASLFSYFVVDNSEFAESRIQRQLLLLGIPFVFLLLWWLRPNLRMVLALIAFNATLFGLYACWEWWPKASRVSGVTHAIHFGNISLLLAFSSLALLPISRTLWWWVFAITGLVLGVAAVLFSSARGTWIVVPVLIVITLVVFTRASRFRRSILAALIILIALIFVGLWQTDSVQNRISLTQKSLEELSEAHWKNSIGYRLKMWEQAWLEIQEAPVLGTGFSGYRSRVLAAVESGAFPERMRGLSTEPHNEYLYQWMTRGAAGLAVYLLILAGAAFFFFRLLRQGSREQIAVAYVGLSLISVLAVGGLTITIIDQRAVIRFLVWIFGILIYCAWICFPRDRVIFPK